MKATCIVLGILLVLLALHLFGGSEFTHSRGGDQYAQEAGNYLTLACILGPIGAVLLLVGCCAGKKG